MGFITRVALLSVLFLSSFLVASAQNSSVETLRSQLSDVQAKEAELQTRLKQLEEDLKPENIEKYFALNGSTHPEELREQRRRQLEGERNRVQTQLDQLGASRTRLETAIATAEAAAYRQSANPSSLNPQIETTNPSVTPSSTTQTQRQPRARRSKHARRARPKRNG
jgi:DNA repair exonuclease SbcCD ATPase subunit